MTIEFFIHSEERPPPEEAEATLCQLEGPTHLSLSLSLSLSPGLKAQPQMFCRYRGVKNEHKSLKG